MNNNAEYYKKLAGGCIIGKKDSTVWSYASIYKSANETYPTNFRLHRAKIKNQTTKSTCVAHALSSMKEIQDYYDAVFLGEYSTMFIYSFRQEQQAKTEGMIIQYALDNLRNVGVCEYDLMPGNLDYIESMVIRFKESRNTELFENAKKHRISNYAEISSGDVDSIKHALYIDKSPVPIGCTLYESFFDTEADGICKIPRKEQEQVCGGHAMLIVGWTTINGKEYWVVQNSWGEAWGDNGYCYMDVKNFPIDEAFCCFDIVDYPINLSDISGRWSESVISQCVRAGILNGYPDGKFKPANTVTREELAAVVVKILNKIK